MSIAAHRPRFLLLAGDVHHIPTFEVADAANNPSLLITDAPERET